MSWGYKIVIILSVFVGGVLFMVSLSMRQTNEMVDTDYYERELEYQGVINARKNLEQLNAAVTIAKDSVFVIVKFPARTVTKLDSGIIEFMRLSNSREDRRIRMEAYKGAVYQETLQSFAKGWYKVRTSWSNDGIAYYQEQNTYIP